jgi:DNA topoisomerase-1
VSKPGSNKSTSALRLAKRLGLHYVAADTLTLRRRRRGSGWSYLSSDGSPMRDRRLIDRLAGLAVPPAYQEVLYAQDPAAHIQAVGRDAAGRLQYRYHADWEKVREFRKARRLARIADALPRIRRSVGQHLAAAEPTKSFTLAAVIELVACTAIRAGGESYARERGTRGATTLLKSNVTVDGNRITLTFRAKGGKNVVKEFICAPLVNAIALLHQLPGRRLFQFRNEAGTVRPVAAQEVNAFLREIAGVKISLKDFRTLLASAGALDRLSRAAPEVSQRKRRRQISDAVRATAEDLANTPAICRKSYVHAAVVTAFEDGVLERFSERLKGCRSPTRRAQVLAEIIATATSN